MKNRYKIMQIKRCNEELSTQKQDAIKNACWAGCLFITTAAYLGYAGLTHGIGIEELIIATLPTTQLGRSIVDTKVSLDYIKKLKEEIKVLGTDEDTKKLIR